MVGILSRGSSIIVTGNGLVLLKLDKIKNNIFNLNQLVYFICLLHLKWLLGTIEQGLNKLAIANGLIQYNKSLLEVCHIFLEGMALLIVFLISFPSLFSAQIFHKVVKHLSFKLLKSLNRSREIQLHLLVMFSQIIRHFLSQPSLINGHYLGVYEEKVA